MPLPLLLPGDEPPAPAGHLAGHDLGRCVAGAAAVHVQLLVVLEEGGQAKVDDLHGIGAVQQDVFQLNITVHHLQDITG